MVKLKLNEVRGSAKQVDLEGRAKFKSDTLRVWSCKNYSGLLNQRLLSNMNVLKSESTCGQWRSGVLSLIKSIAGDQWSSNFLVLFTGESISLMIR